MTQQWTFLEPPSTWFSLHHSNKTHLGDLQECGGRCHRAEYLSLGPHGVRVLMAAKKPDMLFEIHKQQ